MEHAKLGASGAKRWMHCPGSVRACEGIESKSSAYAEEGTAAHALAEKCLVEGDDARQYIDQVIHTDPSGVPWKVSNKMAEYVQEYLDTVWEAFTLGEDCSLEVEKKFSLGWMAPQMFGTNDACVGVPGKKLTIFDLKYGAGLPVEVEDNPQLLYYALGALGKDNPDEYNEVEICIVQPRCPHKDGSVRRQVLSVEEVYKWAETVLDPAVSDANELDAPLVPGEWCRSTFCDALGSCKAVADQAMSLAKIEFADKTPTPPKADSLTVEQLAKVLAMSPIISSFLSEVKAHAENMLNSGEGIPGFKLVSKKANRRWKDPKKVKSLLGLMYGDVIFAKRAVLSVAKMEKIIDKKELEDFWEKPDVGNTIAPISDRRREVVPSALSDFMN